MKYTFLLAIIFKTTISLGQTSATIDSIEQPVYDTTSMDIKSTNSFYFCSILYKIPRDCDKKDQSNCCSFTSQVFTHEKNNRSGQIGCFNGTSLFWTYYDNEKTTKNNFESLLPQFQKQMKKFEQKEIKLTVCQKPVVAYRLDCTTPESYDFSQIIFYGNINGQNVIGQLYLHHNQKSSTDLGTLFQQIVQF